MFIDSNRLFSFLYFVPPRLLSLLRPPAFDSEIDLSVSCLRMSQFLKCISRREEACWRSYERGCTDVSFAEVLSAPMTYERGVTQW